MCSFQLHIFLEFPFLLGSTFDSRSIFILFNLVFHIQVIGQFNLGFIIGKLDQDLFIVDQVFVFLVKNLRCKNVSSGACHLMIASCLAFPHTLLLTSLLKVRNPFYFVTACCR